ncbi:recombinase family protein [Streptomyces sp. NPDC055681]
MPGGSALYVSERLDDRPFDAHDEVLIVAPAGAAASAIDDARLYEQAGLDAEQFPRLLLLRLPEHLEPFEAAATYIPASTPGQFGGGWYDTLLVPDQACAAVIGDVVRRHDHPDRVSPAHMPSRYGHRRHGTSCNVIFGDPQGSPPRTERPVRIGYARTSTARQEPASQLEALHRAKCRKVFKEQISTRIEVRPVLEAALSPARLFKEAAPETPVVFTVHELKRLGRFTDRRPGRVGCEMGRYIA